MSNRNTKVYDDLLVNASTTNEEICKDLNLPHNGNNQCVDDTKYYVNNSNSVKITLAILIVLLILLVVLMKKRL